MLDRDMPEFISIALTQDEALVLFEFFARFAETNRFSLEHNAEFLAFSHVSAQIDKVLVEPFDSDYSSLLAAARGRIAEGFEGRAPGVAGLDPGERK